MKKKLILLSTIFINFLLIAMEEQEQEMQKPQIQLTRELQEAKLQEWFESSKTKLANLRDLARDPKISDQLKEAEFYLIREDLKNLSALSSQYGFADIAQKARSQADTIEYEIKKRKQARFEARMKRNPAVVKRLEYAE